ncbi:VWA domain-containing protein [Thiocapsa marina]|uniref:von Willebrand factor type A n=1 Tax=Thiocapsa marina 5811 TaxID=768671 RepID=F9U659_9GAMM|nr:VWA domain-containing protein [Thiocapsa marina]EGV20632.1 von Willebrand factor type A [Thiocapsa marina 5811]
MTPKTLTDALPIVAAAYGRKFGISVRVGGTQALTDGGVIVIPAIGTDPTARTLAWGYLAHEAAHVRYTDFALPRAHTPLERFIQGVIEDIRIEGELIAAYPGTRRTLDAVVAALVADGSLSAVCETERPSDILGNGFLALARHRYRKQDALASHAKEADRVMRAVFQARFVHRLQGLMSEIPRLASTAASIDLARRIVGLIEEDSQEQPPPAPQQSDADHGAGSDPASDPDTGNGAGQNDDDAQETSTNSRSVDDAEQGDAGDGGSENGASAGDGGEDRDKEDEKGQDGRSADSGTGSSEQSLNQGRETEQTTDPDSTTAGNDARRALQQVLSATDADLPEDLFASVAQALNGQTRDPATLLPAAEAYLGDLRSGRMTLDRVKGRSAKLTARLQGLIETRTQERTRAGRRGQSLSPRHLHRAGVGDPRVFRIREQAIAPNTALHLLVDLSSSMSAGRDAIALDAAAALALALEPVKGVSRAVTAFPSLQGHAEKVTRILAHGERVASRVGAFVQRGRGGTPMTGALWFAAADLLARRETRKVIITLTDGQPDDLCTAADLIEQAGAAGIEMIGVGIAVDVGRLFPIAVRIDAVADLKTALFGIAEQLLLT